MKKQIGCGCFGKVYKGVNNDTSLEVAIKAEEAKDEFGQLSVEASMLAVLRQPVQPQGFVEFFYFGQEGAFNVLVMEMLGRSLEDRMQERGKLQVKTTLLMAEQVLCRIEYLHSKGFVHRDIKPENFMFGVKGRIHHVYLIDFGLSKRYWAGEKGGRHLPMKQGRSLTGTARYASLNAHRGCEQGRRDDLEAIGHMLFYFIRGSLPWSGLDARTQAERHEKILQKKEQTPISELRANVLPKAFEDYLSRARGLDYMDRPDYNKLRSCFRDELTKSFGQVEEHEYEWFEKQPPKHLLEPLAAWKTLQQPDDVQAPSKVRRSCCLCGGPKPKD